MPVAGKATLSKIDELGVRLNEATALKKQAERDIASIKAEMLELAEKFTLPDAKSGAGKSEFAFVPSGELRVTRPDPPTPTIDPQRLFARILDHFAGNFREAAPVFLRVVEVKTIDVDPQAWNEAREAEEVMDRYLLESMVEKAAPKPSVVFTPKG